MSYSISVTNLNTIQQHIQQYSPNPHKVNIIAVTKGFSYHAILSAIHNKIYCIGENRVQEFLNKKKEVVDISFESHLIGHLQSNKIKKAINLFDVIQTVDTISLAEKINKQMEPLKIKKNIFIQINVGNDPKKFGFSVKNIFKEVENINKMQYLQIDGVMTILPFLDKPSSSEKLFEKTRKVAEKINTNITPTCSKLSMGMSRDYVYALKQGATHIRIGTFLYGDR
tara:strand:- start:98 stop:775 length:678 start_codon:yes stop_codon:yes gene_type:complete